MKAGSRGVNGDKAEREAWKARSAGVIWEMMAANRTFSAGESTE